MFYTYAAIVMLTSTALALVAGAFCGFNDFEGDDEPDATSPKPEVAQ